MPPTADDVRSALAIYTSAIVNAGNADDQTLTVYLLFQHNADEVMDVLRNVLQVQAEFSDQTKSIIHVRLSESEGSSDDADREQ